MSESLEQLARRFLAYHATGILPADEDYAHWSSMLDLDDAMVARVWSLVQLELVGRGEAVFTTLEV